MHYKYLKLLWIPYRTENYTFFRMESVLQINDVFIMMRYPATIGGLGEGELDQVFGAIMDVRIIKKCNFFPAFFIARNLFSTFYFSRLL